MDAKARAFAEEAIGAVGRLDAPAARTFIAQAFEHDHKLGALTDAVYLACSEIDAEGEVSPSTWNTIADAVDSPDLFAVVEGSRS